MSKTRSGLSIWIAAAVAALTLGVPAAAYAGLTEGLLDNVTNTVNHATQSGGGGGSGNPASPAPAPQPAVAPAPSSEGATPVAQGTVGAGDTSEEASPLPIDQGSDGEDVVVGRSRGEQNGDDYQGQVTLFSFAPFGTELFAVTVDSQSGESNQGPFAPLQANILDPLCEGSDGQACLTVLAADSSSDENGSTNHFQVFGANFGDGQATANVGESNGNISDDGQCQTSHSDSTVAAADAGDDRSVSAYQSKSDSTACNDGSSAQETDSSGLNILGAEVPLPGSGCGAENPVPDSPAGPAASVSCNSRNGAGGSDAVSAAAVPDQGSGGAAGATGAATKSSARAPGKTSPPSGGGSGSGNGSGNGSGDGNGPGNEPSPNVKSVGGSGGPGAGPNVENARGSGSGPSAGSPVGSLPFTGAEIAFLMVIGLVLVVGGLVLRGLGGVFLHGLLDR